ncbi:ribosome maturation factor RimP [Alicyclobacillus cellulosilyticus]|uniref:Ribosome maturation factor RimP n=1 Tax=Alicyclobacillus cellulosilyticus TaxID=1003997 RepID=A0A917NEH8_9BACL|nr:ribosome maturation factor RimP [Alicyclobacillus cellulosilyticus]GGI94528.1 ribosome maturation factor RimP [Alicyclobacillus cellulosilyticus]
MPKERIQDIVEQLARPIVDAAGLELVDVEFKKEGATWYLRVFIDKPGGVDIDDCSQVSERLSERLDEVDPIPMSYVLEVSSPGAERPLKKPSDFAWAVGRYVRVSLYEPIDGQKVFEGTLDAFDGERLTMACAAHGKGKSGQGVAIRRIDIPLAKVASARLAIAW